jgi:hypothetical protein
MNTSYSTAASSEKSKAAISIGREPIEFPAVNLARFFHGA